MCEKDSLVYMSYMKKIAILFVSKCFSIPFPYFSCLFLLLMLFHFHILGMEWQCFSDLKEKMV